MKSKGLHLGLWAVQVVLGLMFGFAGVLKSTTPIAELTEQMGWPGDIPAAMVRFIGIAELLGALGLILPAATRILPILTPVAASGLVLVMTLALGFHATRGELAALPVNAVLGALAGFVAWGRFRGSPIEGRS